VAEEDKAQDSKGNHTSVATDKCLARTHDIRKISQNVYDMLSESRTVYWGLDAGWKGTDKTHDRFCKTIGVPRFAANNVTELELGRDSTRGTVLSTTAKRSLRLLRMDSLEIVRTC
jgi:hypothetical protein